VNLMGARRLPPVAAVISFIDRINHGDVAGLGALMTDDHELLVFDEAPVRGREANVAAWRGYADAFPGYVIYPRVIAERDGRVAVLGHTTGSHLGLPDDEERRETLIWLAEVDGGLLRRWTLLPDTPENRRDLGLDVAHTPAATEAAP
jgi:ketosteroid isomerase-like protein